MSQFNDAKSIEIGLKRGQCVLIDNSTSSSGIWKDLKLIAQNIDDKQVILQGWCACQHCHQLFRTHSDPDEKGKRKNYGLSSQQRHVASCTRRQSCSSGQPSVANFVMVKKGLSSAQANKLKVAELKYVVGGMHSFLSIEQEGLLNLAQTCIGIGSEVGNVQVNSIWYGRKTVQTTAIEEYNKFTVKLKEMLASSIIAREVATCTDLWTDDHKKRSYLDVTAFWLDEGWNLKHTMLRCKLFEAERKTAENIKQEIHSIMTQFDLPIGDTPITTDAGANIVAALGNETRYQCMAHRLSTVLGDAWSRAIKGDKSLCALDNAVRDVSSLIHRSDAKFDDLPLSLKSSSATRPWRSFYEVHNSFYTSYDQLREILERRNMEHRLVPVSPMLLKNVVEFFKPFNAIFDHLEMARIPTIQNVIPSYYLLVNMLSQEAENKHPAILLLERGVLDGLEKKYWPSTTVMHQLATVLDPTFRNLAFIEDDSFRRQVIRDVREAVRTMAPYLKTKIENPCSPPAAKKTKNDPFLMLRGQSSAASKPASNTSVEEAVVKEYDEYLGIEIIDAPTNPLTFWRVQLITFPLLSQLARKVYVIQASSGESERHFSSGGSIVTSKRSSMNSDTVECLVVLKEASLNGLW
jgi:hypothetical protein